MKSNKDFAVFILTHGRPDNVKTTKTLLKCGYTGRICYIVDNEDKTVNQYIENFGKENVFVFDKKAYADKVDEGNNFDERRTITHARNACFDIAEQIGVTYFMQLDDDYTSFSYRLFDNGNIHKSILNFDNILYKIIDFYNSNNFKSVALSQGGDFLGGISNGSGIYRFSKRKCMNSFLCSTERRFQFIGAMNEDVNTYTTLGSRGNLFFTIPFASLNQTQTQSQSGGITDMYLKYGTYCKAFTTVIMMPSSVNVNMMKSEIPRLHHSIKWSNTVPMIVKESLKKV